MSTVKINFNKNNSINYSELELPIFLVENEKLYQLIVDNNDDVNLVSFTDGRMEFNPAYKSIEQFFLDSINKNFRLVDLEINVKQ